MFMECSCGRDPVMVNSHTFEQACQECWENPAECKCSSVACVEDEAQRDEPCLCGDGTRGECWQRCSFG